jgi:undecaprenyl-diphosphatase
MTYIQAIIIAIIEGLTEFLPVSSTGHMILADSLMHIQDKEFAKTFEIVIQLGAIMAVLLIYFKRFFVGITI